MNVFQEKIIESIDELIKKKLKELKFNYTLEAKITKIMSPIDYEISYQNKTYGVKSINNQEYLVGDLVYVMVLNGDFSNKIVLSKIP